MQRSLPDGTACPGIVLLHGGAALAQDARIVIGQTVALSGPIAEHGKGAAAGAKLFGG